MESETSFLLSQNKYLQSNILLNLSNSLKNSQIEIGYNFK